MSAAAALSQSADVGLQVVHGRRIYDANSAIWMVKLFPGEYYVTRRTDEVLVTVLGSCVSACIRDPHVGVAGMNHFMLPQNESGSWGHDEQSARFGNFAMEKLINELIKAGCARERLEVKVFGGGNVIDSSNAIGSNNAEFVLRYLEAEGLACAAQDLGGAVPRRIHYFPANGRVVRRLLATGETTAVAREESDYRNRLRVQKSSGDIELFGEN